MGVPFVGLTGGLGAGKSTALALLEKLGAQVLSTDALVHELYESSELRGAVSARLGAQVLDGEGRVDRGAVAARVFVDEELRGWLEGLIWPLVGARVLGVRGEVIARKPAPAALVVETPLLFEAGMEGMYDATIAVIARDELRAQRIAARGQEALAQRERRQLGQEEKAARATFVVRNDGSERELEEALADVLGKLGA